MDLDAAVERRLWPGVIGQRSNLLAALQQFFRYLLAAEAEDSGDNVRRCLGWIAIVFHCQIHHPLPYPRCGARTRYTIPATALIRIRRNDYDLTTPISSKHL